MDPGLVVWLIQEPLYGGYREEAEARLSEAVRGCLPPDQARRRLRIEVLNWGTAYHCLAMAGSGGTCEPFPRPHLVHFGTTWTASLASAGLLRPLAAPRVSEEGGAVRLGGSTVPFFPAALETCRVVLPGHDGSELYGLPLFTDVRLIAYRRDIVEQVLAIRGIPKDGEARLLREEDLAQGTWTLADFHSLLGATRDLARAGVLDNRRFLGHAGPLDRWPLWLGTAWENNLIHVPFGFLASAVAGSSSPEPLLGPDGELRMDDAVLAGWRAYFQLFADDLVPWPSAANLDRPTWQLERSGFYAGRTAFGIEGPWVQAGLCAPSILGDLGIRDPAECRENRKKTVGLALFPRRDPATPSVHFVGGGNLGIPSGLPAAEEDAAWDLLRCVYTKHGDEAVARVFDWIPAAKERVPADVLAGDLRGVVLKAVEQGRSYPPRAAFGGRVEPVMMRFMRRAFERLSVCDVEARPELRGRAVEGVRDWLSEVAGEVARALEN